MVNGNHHIPTLDEVIETVDKLVILNIELKGKNTAKPTFKLLEKFYKNGWKKTALVRPSFL